MTIFEIHSNQSIWLNIKTANYQEAQFPYVLT